jgi:hypothetical protein
MGGVNWLSLVYEVFWKLASLANALYNFLFYELSLLGLEISLWQLLGGTSIVILLVARLAKLLVPLV